MSLNRRKFIQLSTVTLAGIPLAGITKNADWYDLADGNTMPKGDLYAAFKNPPNIAKPFVRWWWNGNRIVKEELLRELDMLKELGIGGVEINSIRFPETADPMNYKELTWLSDEWIAMVDFTLKAAKDRGMICDIIMGSGWPFGGEFLKKDEQTQMMALQTRNIKGGQVLKLSKAELLKSVDPPISSKHNNVYRELCYMRLAPANLDSIGAVVNLDNEVDKDDISITVPDGDYVLYYLVKMTGFMAVMFGAPGAAGPVLNHFNKKAVAMYLNKMSDAITPKLGLMGSRIRSVFMDSLELEGANWSDDMAQEFEKRRKYSLLPYLPFILYKTGRLGMPLDEKYGSVPTPLLTETLERVRYDFETVKMELFQERFLDTFLAWCKKNGLKSRVQAYGREYHPSDSSMQIDIPECETWLRRHTGDDLKEFGYATFNLKQTGDVTGPGRSYSEVNKFVSSGARLAGKKLVSCEEITNTEMVFNATLERIKQTADQSNLSGVTHSILHGFNYSPKDAPFPGWVRYGTFFNERNPWWPYLKQFVGYKGRLSAVFQNGTMMSDIAVMHPLPDLWSKYGSQWDPFPENAYPYYVHNIWEAIHQNGSGCDYVSESILQKATFPNGKLTYGPRQYKALLVVEADTIHHKTAQAIKRFANAGGKIIFIERYPSKAPGFYGNKSSSLEVAGIINSAKAGKGVALYPAPKKGDTMLQWYKGLQSEFDLSPYVKMDNPQTMVSQVYYHFDNADAFFISNYSNKSRFEFNAEFDVAPNRTAWLWDAETGDRYLYPTAGKKNILKITLGPAETKLIVFDTNRQGKAYNPVIASKKAALNINGVWDLALNHVDGSTKTKRLEKLIDFKEDAELVKFAGNAVYSQVFQIANIKGVTYLNLGKVTGVSEVTLNGKNLGNRWYGDHIYPINGVVKQGDNTLSIKLTTTLGNYMATSLKDNKDTIKWVKNKKQPLYTQGVLGPVEIG